MNKRKKRMKEACFTHDTLTDCANSKK